MSLFLIPYKGRKVSDTERKRRERERAKAQRSMLLQKQADQWAKRYPELYAKVRSPDWRAWYESVTGEPWNPDWESHYSEADWMALDAENLELDRSAVRGRRDALKILGDRSQSANERRRAIMVLATPRWASRAKIQAIYAERARLSQETGILHHVDHEIPLQGRLVCGLHVHGNLRVIPASDNLVKSNRYPVV